MNDKTKFRFERLAVWRRAVDFADFIYTVTRTFPTDERFGLTSQMRRASVSISANIAEGSGRVSDADFRRFVEYAYGSLMEVLSEAEIARRQDFLLAAAYRELRKETKELARILCGLVTVHGVADISP